MPIPQLQQQRSSEICNLQKIVEAMIFLQNSYIISLIQKDCVMTELKLFLFWPENPNFNNSIFTCF